MKDKVEIWITISCREVVKAALLNRGIAAGNEYRFDPLGWKILVTRTGDLFLEVLRRALEYRIGLQHADLDLGWRLALGEDELLLVPGGLNRERELTRIREIMAFLHGLLYEKRFVDAVLRTVLTDIINTRAEEHILRGQYEREAAIGRMVGELNALDVAKLPIAPPAPPKPPAAAKPPALKIADSPAADERPPE
jgi:hypothetical protein